MKKIFLLILSSILVLATNSFADSHIFFSKHSQSFLKERNKSNGPYSRQLHNKDVNKSLKSKNSTKAAILSVGKGKHKTLKNFGSYFGKKKNHKVFDLFEGHQSMVLDSLQHIDIIALQNNQFDEANAALRKVLPESMASQFIAYNISTETTEGTFGIENTGYIIHYQRLFEDRVILDGCNSLDLIIDGKGTLTNIEVNLEDIEITNEAEETSENTYENQAALMVTINNNFSRIYDSESNNLVEIDSVEVDGVAEAYCPEFNKKTFHPCLSYSTSMKTKKRT